MNTLDDRYSDHPKELLTSYFDLGEFAENTQSVDRTDMQRLLMHATHASEETARALESAIEMREAMYAVFWAIVKRKPIPAGHLHVVTGFIQEAAQHFKLVSGQGHFDWQLESKTIDFRAPLWPVARSAGELLTSDQLQYVRACASKTCEWLFLDETKNHRRRWCDMTKCGNRAKVKRFYTRNKEASK